MTTFAELGISFPLFDAPIHYAAAFVESARCNIRGNDQQYFYSQSEVVWIEGCRWCGAENKLPQNLLEGGRLLNCQNCGLINEPGRVARSGKTTLMCFKCVKAENVQFPKDTEFGMVGEEHAVSGVTGGVPGLETDQFEVVVIEQNWTGTDHPTEQDVWSGARVPSELLWELLWTPRFFGWQEERWLFCCRQPMVYMGRWPDLKKRFRPKDPGALFAKIYASTGDDTPCDDWARAARDFEGGDPLMHVFRRRSCEQFRAYIDVS